MYSAAGAHHVKFPISSCLDTSLVHICMLTVLNNYAGIQVRSLDLVR